MNFSLFCSDFLGSQARPASCPRTRSLARQSRSPKRQAPQPRTAWPDGSGHKQQPGTERHKSAALRLPGAAAGSPQGSLNCRTHRIFAHPLCLRAFVVRSVVDGYNYPLIVIANRRHCFPKYRAMKNAPSGGQRYRAPAPEREPARVHAGPLGLDTAQSQYEEHKIIYSWQRDIF